MTKLRFNEHGQVVLSRQDKKLVGIKVIYRLHKYALPHLGTLSHRNHYADWEIGAWVVRDDNDERTYVLESRKGARWREASQKDIRHYRKRPALAPNQEDPLEMRQEMGAEPEKREQHEGIGEQVARKIKEKTRG